MKVANLPIFIQINTENGIAMCQCKDHFLALYRDFPAFFSDLPILFYSVLSILFWTAFSHSTAAQILLCFEKAVTNHCTLLPKI